MASRCLLLRLLLTSKVSLVLCARMQGYDGRSMDVRKSNSTMLSSDMTAGGHIICPVLNALVQNGDLELHDDGNNVDADAMVSTLMRAGLNQPAYSGEKLPAGITQSNAFEYTLGIFLKNKAANYRDSNGALTLPIGHLGETNHEHNSRSGITSSGKKAFENVPWEVLESKADKEVNGVKCWSRDAWAAAMRDFEARSYDGKTTGPINNAVVRNDHSITGPAGTWGFSWVLNKLLKRGAQNGNEVGGKRLVAGVSQVFNGMVNLFWTGDYGNLDLYKARLKLFETDAGQAGLSFPWLDDYFCLPVEEMKSLLIDGTYPASSGYAAMAAEDYHAKGKVYQFPKSRCKAAYFLPGGMGYVEDDACVDGVPPLVAKSASRAELIALHTFFGK